MIKKVEVKGNTPGKDKRGQKPDFKAQQKNMTMKQAVMGRSNFGKKGTQSSAILD